MGRIVVFEVNKHTGMMDSDTMVIYDSFNYINWYHNSSEYKLCFSYLGADKIYHTIKDLLNNQNKVIVEHQVIPVGSIEFVEAYLGKEIKAINIPNDLNSKEFTGRHIEICNIDRLNQLSKVYNKLFIKDATRCKKFEPMIYEPGTQYENLPNQLFVSEYIDIKSEYRAFIFRGNILDCRQYIGTYKDSYDYTLLEKAVNSWKDKPSAFTLDIAVTNDGKTVIIEAHNFISCGLYGFSDYNKLAYMICNAYLEEYNNKSR